MKKVKSLALILCGVVFLAGEASANPVQIKAYKEAFLDESPKCMMCHMDKMPKKEDGKHELNDYGKSVLKENPKPDAETYKKIGKAKLPEGAKP